jgi:hypothetical protein
MSSYSVYGLNLHSEIPLPGLPAGSASPDVSIRCKKLPFSWHVPTQGERSFTKTSDGVLLTWNKYARFLIAEGSQVQVELASANVDESVVRHLILGPVFAVLHHQRGMAVFHASAVELPTGGAAFLAGKGYGKSTQAAAFAQRGASLITDDLLILNTNKQPIQALPGVPFLKLWPPSMEMMGEDPSAHPQVKTDLDKRTLALHERAVCMPVDMRAIFLLDHGPQLEIIPLAKKDALRRIMPHWYGALFDGELFPVFGIERQFWDCTSVVENLPIYLLKRPVGLDLIPEICQAVECHV